MPVGVLCSMFFTGLLIPVTNVFAKPVHFTVLFLVRAVLLLRAKSVTFALLMAIGHYAPTETAKPMLASNVLIYPSGTILSLARTLLLLSVSKLRSTRYESALTNPREPSALVGSIS